jgi:hypothetical protein
MQYAQSAQNLAQLGRNGDSTLMHVTPQEVGGLQSLAQANGTTLTINPNTGLPEAFNLGSLLPMAAGFALGPAGFGLMSSLQAGMLVGGLSALSSGDIGQGIMAGFGAYGGSELGASFANAGSDIAANAANTTNALESSAALADEGLTGAMGISNTGYVPTNTAMGGANLTTAGGRGISSGFGGANLTTAGGRGIPSVTKAIPARPYIPPNAVAQGLTPNLSAANPLNPVTNPYQYSPQAGGVTLSNAQNLNPTNAPNLNSSLTQNSMRQYNPNASYDAFDFRPSTQTNNPSMSSNPIQPYNPPPTTNSVTDTISSTDSLGNYSGEYPGFNNAKVGFNKLTEDPSAFWDAYKQGNAVDGVALTNPAAAMKIGMSPAMSIVGGLEDSDLYGDPYNPIPDRRFRGPNDQLNLAGVTGLNLAANGGYINKYANGGGVSNLLRNMIEGTASNMQTTGVPEGMTIADVIRGSRGYNSAGKKLAGGGYLNGGNIAGDGVSDSIPATIDGEQPAALSKGEFVVPARIVSEIGNGSSDAGAERLYAMLDNIERSRKRTVGKGNIAVDTNAERYMPA